VGDQVAELIRARWEANAEYWITVIRERRDRYRTELTDAAVLDAIGPCTGLRILDAGCGEGYLTRELTAQGADAVGVDACQRLIASAGALAGSFAHASVNALPFADAVFDLVVANHLFSHLQDPSHAVREFGRVLRGGRRLVILTLHPCFYVEGSERAAMTSVPASRYFTTRGVDQHFLVDGLRSPSPITSWLRPLEAYSTMLHDAGFVLTGVREPRPTEEQLRGDPWWRESFPTPLFILLTAEQRSP
jgi:SAM-dependent methyltransferase